MNDVHIFLRRGDAALAFLLEAVKDKHCLGKLNGVHGSVGAANIVLHHFQHTLVDDNYLGRQVELFFKWIKQNLRIKAFVGTSANAVKTQIWCAVCTYVVVAIVKKRLALEGSMHAILQVLSLSLFEVKPLTELLGEQLLNDETGEPEAQFCLFPEISGQ